MKTDLSICIPTYERIDFLQNAIQSCLQQIDINVEIVISDDSKKTNEYLINNIKLPLNFTIRYFHHQPSLRQNLNVDFLLKQAKGSYLILLHDDDQLLPGSIETYWNKAKSSPESTLFFGKIKLMNNDGILLSDEEIESFNKSHSRNNLTEGRIENLKAMLMQNFCPGSTFMVSTKIAQEVGYKTYETIGDACDVDFLIRLANREMVNFYFINNFLAAYRLTDISVTKGKFYNGTYYRHLSLIENGYTKFNKTIYKKILRKDARALLSYLIKSKQYSKLISFSIKSLPFVI